jgi:DNA-binding MarR family transcriptional regulator
MATSLHFDAIEAARRNWIDHELPEPDAMAAATSIMRAQQIVSTAVEQALRPLGLTFARFELLMLLTFSAHGSLPMTKIGERLMVHPTGISKLVDKLEEQRLVRRDAHPTDRRTTLATILPDGRKLARRGAKVVGEVRFGMDLSVSELRELTTVITALRLHVGDFPSQEH